MAVTLTATKFLISALVVSSFLASAARGDNVNWSGSNRFFPNTSLSSSQMNSNFDELIRASNDNYSKIGDLTTLSGLATGKPDLVQAINALAGASQGATGASGSSGTTGATGGTGGTGVSGASGQTGATGETGANGAVGNSGMSGASGASGNSGQTGASGASGNSGQTGASGASGSTGATGVTGAGETGASGQTGQSGASGQTGATGKTGDTGLTGATGATGLSGDTGHTGATGATGANGSNGANGQSGASGATGATGANGSNGANGQSGASGATGATGANGSNGSNGSNGANGQSGASGATGATGSVGAAGASGASGKTGGTGSNGATGATGASLWAGAIGSDIYYNYTANVGIGTNLPETSLHVKGAGSILMLDSPLTTTNTHESAVLFRKSSEFYAKWGIGRSTWNNIDEQNLSFWEDDSAGNVRMTIIPGGNVGIGTTGPTGKLHIVSGATTTPAIVIANTAANNTNKVSVIAGARKVTTNASVAGLAISDDGTDRAVTLGSGGGLSLADPTHIEFFTTTSYASNTGQLRLGIDAQGAYSRGITTDASSDSFRAVDSAGISLLKVRSDGNVGIGNTSPGSKLTVGGMIESWGGYKFANGEVQYYASTATTNNSGSCTTPGNIPVSSSDSNVGCTGFPASQLVAVTCSANGAFSSPGLGLYCRGSGTPDLILCNTVGGSNSNNLRYTCFWHQ